MVTYKTDEEIELIRESGLILGKAHAEVAKLVLPGVKTTELDKVAEEFIRDNGAIPSFKGYNGFPATLCISPNEQVVHGIPNDYILQEGDIISIDCGVFYKGFHSDSAYTYGVGEINEKTENLLKTTKESLYEGIKAIDTGSRIGDISFSIQTYVEERGYSVVRELIGHGVGKKLHEKPDVPNYGRRGRGHKFSNGLVIAIEPMINLGKKEIAQEDDGWTIRTRDKQPSAHFEHDIAVIDGNPEILSTFKYVEEALEAKSK